MNLEHLVHPTKRSFKIYKSCQILGLNKIPRLVFSGDKAPGLGTHLGLFCSGLSANIRHSRMGQPIPVSAGAKQGYCNSVFG